MEVIYGAKEVTDWVARKVPGGFTGEDFNPSYSIGIFDKEGLVAGCIYSNYRPCARNIELTFASRSPEWCTRKNIQTFLGYPFLDLSCNRVTAIVSETNKESMKFVERLGMVKEGVIRQGMDGKNDAIIYGMLYKECKWFDKELAYG